MTVTKKKREKYTIYSLKGDLDLYASGEVRQLLTREMDKGELSIALNLEHVPYMDSSGVGVMIALMQQIKKGEGKLVFYNLQRSPLKVLEMANITALFTPYTSEQDAVKALVS